jgi:hypothetical protein
VEKADNIPLSDAGSGHFRFLRYEFHPREELGTAWVLCPSGVGHNLGSERLYEVIREEIPHDLHVMKITRE